MTFAAKRGKIIRKTGTEGDRCMFGSEDRYQYIASPLIEVICQLRFPAILSIAAQEPAAFQERIRGDYPIYAARQDQVAPRVVNANTPNPTLEPQKSVTNYNFLSEDKRWKVNLTSGFIALSTVSYRRWEEFAGRLDKLLAEFIEIYHPAFFERIGLRYVNAVSRQRLHLEGRPWNELIQPAYLGVMGEFDVEEEQLTKCATDIDMKLEGDCGLKLHAGLGLLGDGKRDPEVKFIFDQDLSCGGNISPAGVPDKLLTLHGFADRVFRGAITSELHSAMGPEPMG